MAWKPREDDYVPVMQSYRDFGACQWVLPPTQQQSLELKLSTIPFIKESFIFLCHFLSRSSVFLLRGIPFVSLNLSIKFSACLYFRIFLNICSFAVHASISIFYALSSTWFSCQSSLLCLCSSVLWIDIVNIQDQEDNFWNL